LLRGERTSEVSPPAEWKRRADEQHGLAYSGYAEVAIDTMWTGELSACDTVALSRVFEMVARTTSPAPSRSILVMGMAKPPVRCLPSNAATSTTQSGSVRPGRADAVLARAVGRGDDEFRPHPRGVTSPRHYVGECDGSRWLASRAPSNDRSREQRSRSAQRTGVAF
jgi:hypothetical protein